MDLQSVFSTEVIDTTERNFRGKDELFRHMARLFEKSGFVTSGAEYVKALYERERMGSTYMGGGMVVPHGKAPCVKRAGVGICHFTPMKYEGEEEELADLAIQYIRVYAIASPFTTMVFAVDNFLRICGKIKSSMALNIVMSILNIRSGISFFCSKKCAAQKGTSILPKA